MRLMKLMKAGALRLAEGSQQRTWIGDRPRDDLSHVPVRSVGAERGPAIGGELREIEHRRTRLKPTSAQSIRREIMLRGDKVGPSIICLRRKGDKLLIETPGLCSITDPFGGFCGACK
jgi:hypothetical protein